jgi:hypothetical protein
LLLGLAGCELLAECQLEALECNDALLQVKHRVFIGFNDRSNGIKSRALRVGYGLRF